MSLDKHLELRERTKKFALRILRMSQAIPKGREANILANQIVRSATGTAANYRAVGLARSKAELSQNLELWWRRLTKLCSGLKCWPRVE
jgi:hypothetical protein